MEKIIKDQAELLDTLRAENEFLHTLVEQKTADINGLLGIAQHWKKEAEDAYTIVDDLNNMLLSFFKKIIESEGMDKETTNKMQELINQLEDECKTDDRG